MAEKIDLTGKRLNKLRIIKYSHRHEKYNAPMWLCKCDCGKWAYVTYHNLLRSFKTNAIKSCGCHRASIMKTLNLKHGYESRTHPLYRMHQVWKSMIQRCHNPNCQHTYKNHGGRGIKVCKRWRESFELFLKDMGERPSNKYSIDRIDNYKGYFRKNCRWVTWKENQRNKRTNRIIIWNEISKCLVEWSEIVDLNSKAISERIKRGWNVERALFTSTGREKILRVPKEPYDFL